MIISCIIVTKDRPQELQRCLHCLQQQSRAPDQIIVVEGGAGHLTNTAGIDYTITTAGITRQRNVARSVVRSDCDVVVYLDDDTELALDGIQRIEQAFVAKKSIVGLTGQISEEAAPGWLKRLFGPITMLYTSQPFGITAGLFNSINQPHQAQAVAWLPGALMCYRWSVVNDIPFDEWFTGYGLGEDLDFSWQVKPRGQLWVDPDIKINHYHSAVGRDWKKFGYMRILNRRYLQKKHFLDWSFFVGMWWANGWLLVCNGWRGIFSMRHRLEFYGLLQGVCAVMK